MPIPAIVGPVTDLGPILYWLIKRGIDVVGPLMSDPKRLSRIGELIVWQGESGQQVVAGLASVSENQQRIERAIANIETTQLALSGSLDVVQGLSMATFGVTSLAAGFLLWRLKSLDNRLTQLAKRIDDIEERLEANDKAMLAGSLAFLCEYENKGRRDDLDRALDKARHSALTYADLVEHEIEGRRRLPVLNYRGRRYIMSLMTELQCMILREDHPEAVGRAEAEKPRLKRFVEATFQETVAKAPEVYLDPALAREGVTLELLASLYEQLQHAGVVTDRDLRDAAGLFEHLREPIYRSRRSMFSRVWSPVGKAKARCLANLRYLIASVEDANRIESIRLLIAESQKRGFSLRELSERIKAWRADASGGQAEPAGSPILAYAFE
jgi:hypothetical protein